MFVLTSRELVALRSQIATSNIGRGGRRYGVTAFTEHGVLMLSSVLRSEQAIQVNIHIMRVFTRMNKLLATNQEILRRLERIERKLADHDEGLIALFEQVKLLMEPPSSPRRRIGFRRGDDV